MFVIKIKTLGSGYSKCKLWPRATQATLTHSGLETEFIKVTDFAEIAAHTVMSTSALAIDDKVVSVGKCSWVRR